MEKANICPVPKVAQPNKKSDWRPISLTSCIGKIQERFVLKELMPTVLKEYNNQYAYLPKHSSTNVSISRMVSSVNSDYITGFSITLSKFDIYLVNKGNHKSL